MLNMVMFVLFVPAERSRHRGQNCKIKKKCNPAYNLCITMIWIFIMGINIDLVILNMAMQILRKFRSNVKSAEVKYQIILSAAILGSLIIETPY